MRYAALFCLVLLAACNSTGAFRSSSQVVAVRGHEHVVQKADARAGIYSATPQTSILRQMNGMSEAEVYVGNLKAIVAATGCPVAMRTIQNEGRTTRASLACPKGTSATF